MEFVAYIDVEGTRVTKEQIATAIEIGLEKIFQYDTADVDFNIDVQRRVSRSEWQPGHLNSLTATQRRDNGD